MAAITRTVAEGKIAVHYDTDGTTVVPGHAITTVTTTLWFDGQIEVEFRGVPLTKRGTPDQRQKPRWLYVEREDRARIIAELGIDTSVRPFLSLLEDAVQQYALLEEAEQQSQE